MKNLPLITVIVPVYNVEQYVAKCIDSILAQTYPNLQIILVNDGSTDHSGEICQVYEQKDPRIRLLCKENGGQASARNYGMPYAQGQYIAFVDSDDWLEPDTYGRLYDAIAEKPGWIAVCGRYNVDEITGEKKPVFTLPQPQQWPREEAVRRFLTWDHMDTAAWDKLFPAELIRGMEFPNGLICEDMPFVFGALKKAEGVLHIATPQYCYLQRQGSTSKSNYNPKSKGLVIYPEEICSQVISEFPALTREGEYYYYVQVLAYIHLLQRSNVRDPAQNRVLRKNLRHILKNPCFTPSQKLRCTLAAMNLLGPVYGLYSKLRGR